ncbi:hypothetical protein FOPE_02671 [Fonsecaea pedrosoi]|nr:hypothetical protein FOPE_02671 [Fonsecaea pedrosoi]
MFLRFLLNNTGPFPTCPLDCSSPPLILLRVGDLEKPTKMSTGPALKILLGLANFVSFVPGSHTRQEILESLDSSIEALKQPKVNVGYLHVPDRATPFEETAKALNEACKAKACRISQPTRWKDS